MTNGQKIKDFCNVEISEPSSSVNTELKYALNASALDASSIAFLLSCDSGGTGDHLPLCELRHLHKGLGVLK